MGPRIYGFLSRFLVLFIAMGFLTGGQVNPACGEDPKDRPHYPPFPEVIGGFRLQGPEEIYGPENLFDYMDGAAELYLAYNFRSMRLVRYSNGEGPTIIVEVFEMPTSEDAFGVFSLEREDEDASIGQGSEIGGGILRFWKGRFFVNVYGETDVSREDLLAIGSSIAETIREQGAEPQLVKLLPDVSEGLVPKSVRFFRTHTCLNRSLFIANKNILLLGPDTKGVSAQLRGAGGKVHLVLVAYPTEHKAIEAQGSFSRAYMPDAQGRYRIRTEDGKWTGSMTKGSLWIGVFGAASEVELDYLIQGVISKAGF